MLLLPGDVSRGPHSPAAGTFAAVRVAHVVGRAVGVVVGVRRGTVHSHILAPVDLPRETRHKEAKTKKATLNVNHYP